MSEAREYKVLHVVGDAVVSALDQSHGLSGTEKCKRATRADPKFEKVAFSRSFDDLQEIIDKCLIEAHHCHGFLNFRHILLRKDGSNQFKRVSSLTIT